MSRQRFVTHPLVLRQVTVLRTERVTPTLLRVTLGGPELRAFKRNGLELPPFSTPTFDDHIKLIFAADGNVESVLPTQNEHGIDWNFSENLITRDYTPRRFDEKTGELELEFVMHGSGPAATWASTAQKGDTLWFVGPKSSAVLPEDTGHIILLGDETALPAIARYLDERPSPAPVTGAIIIPNEESKIDLRLTEQDSIQWITGSSQNPQLLDETIRALPIQQDAATYIFAAGESRALLPVRRYLSRELGFTKGQLNITGYWHAEQDKAETQAEPLPELPTSPLPWLATRAALEVGLIQALASEKKTLTELSAELALAEEGVNTLTATLTEYRILAKENNHFALGEAGQLLLDDEHEIEHFLGYHADQILALLHLPQQIRRDTETAWQDRNGNSLRAHALADRTIYEELMEQAEILQFVGQGLLETAPWTALPHIAVHGPGTLHVAPLLARQKRPVELSIVEEGVGLNSLKENWENLPHITPSFYDTWPSTTAGISALSSQAMTQQELAEHLIQARQHLTQLLLIVEEKTDQLIPQAADVDLIRYALTGQAQRDQALISSLANEAGFTTAQRTALGWGLAAYLLTS